MQRRGKAVDGPDSQRRVEPEASIDLRGTPCPVNFIRSRLKLETVSPGAWLQVDLDSGEPERMVSEGLRSEGHWVESSPLQNPISGVEAPAAVRLLVRRDGA